MPVPTGWHPGEIAAQQARGYEDDVWGGWMNYEEGAPSFMVSFLREIPFLSVTTLDDKGRPWASLLCNDGQLGFLEPQNDGMTLKCTIRAPEGVPIRECLLRLQGELAAGERPYDENGDPIARFQLAAVGVMLHNRRRNKMEGVIVSVEEAPKQKGEDRFVFTLDVVSTFGNCPKYINTRHLVPAADIFGAGSQAVTSTGSGNDLPDDVLSIIASADTLFLATKHAGDPQAYPVDAPRAGNNIRGGPPGFLRTFTDEAAGGRLCIVLPDWSGNRLMQSFGNMTSDPFAGVTIPIWSSEANRRSDILHLTCDAKVLANEEASSIIRGIKGAVLLWPRSWTLVQNGLPLVVAAKGASVQLPPKIEGNVGWSPYNPPLRYLNSEKPHLNGSSAARPTASLIDVHFYSSMIATFTFKLDKPLEYKPGQHIVLDCYELLDTRVQLYTHMAAFRGGEKDLNDDGTRSWTISYGHPSSDDSNTISAFEVTLRRKDRGGVTPSLFRQGEILLEGVEAGYPRARDRVRLPVLGIDGDCILSMGNEAAELRPAYVVSGIGLTPMLPHLAQIMQPHMESHQHEAHGLAIMAVKWNEIEITIDLLRRSLSRQPNSKQSLHLRAYLLAGNRPEYVEEGEEERVQHKSIASSVDLPANVELEVIIEQGKRLTEFSFSSTQEDQMQSQQPSKGFVLPSHHMQEDLQKGSPIVICAGPAFAKTAREAINSLNIPSSRIKNESFSF